VIKNEKEFQDLIPASKDKMKTKKLLKKNYEANKILI